LKVKVNHRINHLEVGALGADRAEEVRLRLEHRVLEVLAEEVRVAARDGDARLELLLLERLGLEGRDGTFLSPAVRCEHVRGGSVASAHVAAAPRHALTTTTHWAGVQKQHMSLTIFMKNWAISERLRLIFLPWSCSSFVLAWFWCGPTNFFSTVPSAMVTSS
jgi:hypothetical protein